jgi:hypothetical protein
MNQVSIEFPRQHHRCNSSPQPRNHHKNHHYQLDPANKHQICHHDKLQPLTEHRPETQCTNTGAGLNHGGAEGSAAHRTTIFFIYIAEVGFGLRKRADLRES